MENLRNEKYEGMNEIIRLHLVELFDANPEMEQKWNTPVTKKTQEIVKDGVEKGEEEVYRSVSDCVEYLKKEAHKLAGNQASIAVDDKTVYGWVNHYIEEEGAEEVHKPREIAKTQIREYGIGENENISTKKPKAEKKKTAEEQGITQLSLFAGL